jgi:hypothetical protein
VAAESWSLGRPGRTSFAGCRKGVVVEGMEVVAGCIEVGAGIDSGTDSEERRSPGFEAEESHSWVLVGKGAGLLGVRSWAEEDIAADLGADSVGADDLDLVRRNNRCLTFCLLFWRVLRLKRMLLS